jgi:hypothetical protein
MRYSILHNGVPVGEVDLDLTGDPAVGVVNPLPGYAAVSSRVQGATRAFISTMSNEMSPNRPALTDGAALGRELELRDENHELVKTDFIELADWQGRPLNVTVWVRARGAFAGVASRPPLVQRSDGASSANDA